MARVSKRPLKKQDDSLDNAHTGFEPIAVTEPEEEKPVENKVKTEVDISALLSQIGELKNTVAEQGRAIQAAYTVPTYQTQQAPEAPKAVSFENLPDPVMEKEAFAAELFRRQNEYIESVRKYNDSQSQERQRSSQASDSLWDDFQDAYPDLAANTDRVEFVATKVADKMRSRGVDMQRYMHGNRSGFMEDIASEYEKVFGKAEGEPEPKPSSRRQPRSQVTEEEEPSRTGGIFGGHESGGRISIPKPGPGDMIRDLHDLQRKSGLF